MKDNTQTKIYGDGTQSRDFTYVANVVEANLLACTSEKAVGEVINIGCGERNTLLQLVDTINTILGESIKPIFDKDIIGDVKHLLAGIAKAKKMFGFMAVCVFEEGLEKLMK